MYIVHALSHGYTFHFQNDWRDSFESASNIKM